jgi:hypothetical protein
MLVSTQSFFELQKKGQPPRFFTVSKTSGRAVYHACMFSNPCQVEDTRWGRHSCDVRREERARMDLVNSKRYCIFPGE